jgi:hypothetical protein
MYRDDPDRVELVLPLVVHVIPNNDLIQHDISDDCTCGPTTEPVKRDDGSVAWLHIHHSLDGREHHEPDHA